jgi:transaldolase
VSIWLDTLSRELLDTGEFAALVQEASVARATSNPTIFASAITGSHNYDAQPRSLLAAGERDRQELFSTSRSRMSAAVYDYGFNVETAGDSPVWHQSETDVQPGDHAD